MTNHQRALYVGAFSFSLLFFGCALAYAASVSVVGLSPLGAVAASTTVSFGVSASGFVNPSYSVADSYTGTGATHGAIDAAGYFSWTPTLYDGGTHVFTITASDASGALATTTVSILVASNAVILQNLAPASTVAVGRALTFSAYAPGFSTPTFSVFDGAWLSSVTPGNMNASSGAFSWTPITDDVGTHTLTVQAADAYGHFARTTQAVTVIAPAVSVRSFSSSVPAGALTTFIATATGFTPTSWTVGDVPSGTATTTSIVAADISPAGVFSWIPLASDVGIHALTVTASDASGNSASTLVSLNVVPAPASPQVTTSYGSASPPATGVASPSAQNTPMNSGVRSYRFATFLGVGSRGAAVLALQQALVKLGFLATTPTGYYGSLTAAAVKKFQTAHGVSPVGYVGPATRAALNGL